MLEMGLRIIAELDLPSKDWKYTKKGVITEVSVKSLLLKNVD